MGALGTKVAGLMGNDDGLAGQVEQASKETDEKVWRLPLPGEYRKLLDSDVADLKNVGGPYGGALDGRAVPAGVRRRQAVGPPRHRRRDAVGERRRLARPRAAPRSASGC